MRIRRVDFADGSLRYPDELTMSPTSIGGAQLRHAPGAPVTGNARDGAGHRVFGVNVWSSPVPAVAVGMLYAGSPDGRLYGFEVARVPPGAHLACPRKGGRMKTQAA